MAAGWPASAHLRGGRSQACTPADQEDGRGREADNDKGLVREVASRQRPQSDAHLGPKTATGVLARAVLRAEPCSILQPHSLLYRPLHGAAAFLRTPYVMMANTKVHEEPTGAPTAQHFAAPKAAGPTRPPCAALPYPPSSAAEPYQPA
jgi:hypothetical protein